MKHTFQEKNLGGASEPAGYPLVCGEVLKVLTAACARDFIA